MNIWNRLWRWVFREPVTWEETATKILAAIKAENKRYLKQQYLTSHPGANGLMRWLKELQAGEWGKPIAPDMPIVIEYRGRIVDNRIAGVRW